MFPAMVTLLVVMLLSALSARIAQDTGLSAAQRIDRQMARQRAESALQLAAAALGAGEPASHDASSDASIEEVVLSELAELADLPLILQRVTATGHGLHARVRLQADYAVDGCESADDDPCLPRVRRIAWRELPD